MRTSEQIDEIATALSKAQSEVKPVEKNGEVNIRTRNGATISFKYSTLDKVLEACRHPFGNNGLCFIQSPSVENGSLRLTTRIIHSSGQWIEDELSTTAGGDMKALGGNITYLRRYALSSMVGIASDEDKDASVDEAATQSNSNQKRNNGNANASTSEDKSMQRKAFDSFKRKVEDLGVGYEIGSMLLKEIVAPKNGFEPDRTNDWLNVIKSQLEQPTTRLNFIAVINHRTDNYFRRDSNLINNQHHVLGSIKKMDDGWGWPKDKDNPEEWSRGLALAQAYADDQRAAITEQPAPETEFDEHLDDTQLVLVDVPEVEDKHANALVEA